MFSCLTLTSNHKPLVVADSNPTVDYNTHVCRANRPESGVVQTWDCYLGPHSIDKYISSMHGFQKRITSFVVLIAVCIRSLMHSCEFHLKLFNRSGEELGCQKQRWSHTWEHVSPVQCAATNLNNIKQFH